MASAVLRPFAAILVLLQVLAARAQYTATYLPANVPAQTEQDQAGTNQCGSGSNQTSLCQNVYINSVTDFCLWAPPEPTYMGVPSTIGETERIEVAWCLRSGYGTRLIPNGAITGAHFVQTPDYVQVTGVGDMTMLNIPSGDEGGELDPHGADGNGNPIGGLVFGETFGGLQQYHEWTNFMDYQSFCFRACKDAPEAPLYCNHVYDLLGCDWNMPGNYDAGVFENCMGDSTEPMGIYVSGNTTSTFSQGDPVTPSAHTPGSSSACSTFNTVSNQAAQSPTATALPSAASASVSSVSAKSASASGSSRSGSASASGSSPSGSSARGAAVSLVAGHEAIWLAVVGIVAGGAFLL